MKYRILGKEEKTEILYVEFFLCLTVVFFIFCSTKYIFWGVWRLKISGIFINHKSAKLKHNLFSINHQNFVEAWPHSNFRVSNFRIFECHIFDFLVTSQHSHLVRFLEFLSLFTFRFSNFRFSIFRIFSHFLNYKS